MKAKKSLGQNFLNSASALGAIANAANLSNDETVLEIGPGKGVLTKELIKLARHVIAIEKDETLVELLQQKFSKEISDGKLKIISGDILNFDLKNLISPESHFKIVANIPYYITGQFLRQTLSNEVKPKSMTLIIQKEVAERIIAKHKKESLLSISIKVYGKPVYIKTVPAGAFVPTPKVDSAIINILDINNKFFSSFSAEFFFSILHGGFAHKRKLLIRNLEKIADKITLEKIFASCNIPIKSRAENLSLSDWESLTKKLQLEK